MTLHDKNSPRYHKGYDFTFPKELFGYRSEYFEEVKKIHKQKKRTYDLNELKKSLYID
jgi:hypothetical protein